MAALTDALGGPQGTRPEQYGTGQGGPGLGGAAQDRLERSASLSDASQSTPSQDTRRLAGTPVFPMAPGTTPETVEWLRAQQLPEGTALVVRTSGSSGTPKAVALSAEALRASAVATHVALAATEPDTVDTGAVDTRAIALRQAEEGYDDDSIDDQVIAPALRAPQWLVALPCHLISGLQMLVRSLVAGTDPVFVDGAFDPENLLVAAERMQHPRRYVSLVPVQLARLLDLAERDDMAADALRGFSGVLVGGQALSQQLRQRSHDLGIPLRRSYGMTETSGGCVYDGVEIGDSRVRIRDGEVQLAGSSLALGYVGDETQTAERFIIDQARDGTRTRWYRTGDSGELLGGMLRVTGRIDRVIVSGGVNVSLDEVERVANAQSGWARALALGVSDPEWGERAVLVIAEAGMGDPESNQSEPDGAEMARLTFAEVRAAIRAQLGPAAAPERSIELPALPLLPGGKPDRVAIAAQLRDTRG